MYTFFSFTTGSTEYNLKKTIFSTHPIQVSLVSLVSICVCATFHIILSPVQAYISITTIETQNISIAARICHVALLQFHLLLLPAPSLSSVSHSSPFIILSFQKSVELYSFEGFEMGIGSCGITPWAFMQTGACVSGSFLYSAE